MIYIGIAGTLGLIGFFWWLVQQVITAKSNEAAFKTEISTLKEKMSELKTKNADLEKKNIELEHKTSASAHKKELLANYQFNSRSGISIQITSKKPYCTVCLNEKLQENELKVRSDGWQCVICHKFYADPDYRSPQPSKPFYY